MYILAIMSSCMLQNNIDQSVGPRIIDYSPDITLLRPG